MMKLVDAISHRFPQENEWAARALASLNDVLEPDTPIHGLVEGWCLVGDGPSAHLVDVLFVLTDSRLGIGHAGEVHVDRWVDLTTVVVVDAIENSLYPLQTIELQFTNAAPLTIGWPHSFSARFVEVLERLRDAGLMQPKPTDTASGAAACGQPSVAQPSVAQPTVAQPSGDGALRPALAALLQTPESAPVADDDREAVLAALDRISGTDAAERAARLDAAGETFFGELEAETTTSGDVPEFGADGRPPWEAMGAAWPQPIEGVNYLGGHPSAKRKRKGGVMSFSPEGLRVKGTGLGRWDIVVDWNHANSIEVQGSDEIMFSEAIRVPITSSVLVLETTDGHRLFFEVAGRRPPSLRSEIAAVLSMVHAARTHRAANAGGDD